MSERRARDSLIALDLLRFAAAGLVVAYHYAVAWIPDDAPLTVRLMAGVHRNITSDPFSRNGWVGVEVFFVLSGYVIAKSALGATPAEFAWRRLLRLWPGALVCATLTAVVLWTSGVAWRILAPAWLASAMLWPGATQIDGSYWTLGIEISFYLLVFALMAIGQWHPLRVAGALTWIGVIFWGASLATGFAGMALRESWQELFLLRHGCLFALGIMLEERHRSGETPSGLSMAPALLCGLIVVWFTAIATSAKERLKPMPIAASLIFITGVLVIALAPRLQCTFVRWRLRRVAVALGLATYPLYLVHQRIGDVLIGLMERSGVPHGPTLVFVAFLMVMASVFIANSVEPAVRSSLRLMHRKLCSGYPIGRRNVQSVKLLITP